MDSLCRRGDGHVRIPQRVVGHSDAPPDITHAANNPFPPGKDLKNRGHKKIGVRSQKIGKK
jgi:hypothetical protein